MPRILVLANSGNIIGGGELSLLGLLEALDRSRHEPTVVCPFEGDLIPRLEELGVPVRIAAMPSLRHSHPVRTVKALRGILRIIREGFDLVHADGTRCIIYGGVAARLAGAPCLWHVRILDSDGWLDHARAALATVIVANSGATARRFDFARWAAAKVRVVHNGIDPAIFQGLADSSSLRALWGGSSDVRLIGNVSRLFGFKGQRYFLDAAALLTKRHADARFVIVGDGPLRGELEEQAARLGLSDRVVFAGHVEDVPAVMAALDIFVLSSIEEHFGRVVIEAMAAGVPVVATAAGGVPEIIEDGRSGLLVPPRDPAAMAEAIGRLLEEEETRRALVTAGMRRITEKFTIAHHAAAVQRLYDELLSRD